MIYYLIIKMDLIKINIRNINLLEKLPDKLPIYNGLTKGDLYKILIQI